jgi:hypothetical protein
VGSGTFNEMNAMETFDNLIEPSKGDRLVPRPATLPPPNPFGHAVLVSNEFASVFVPFLGLATRLKSAGVSCYMADIVHNNEPISKFILICADAGQNLLILEWDTCGLFLGYFLGVYAELSGIPDDQSLLLSKECLRAFIIAFETFYLNK